MSSSASKVRANGPSFGDRLRIDALAGQAPGTQNSQICAPQSAASTDSELRQNGGSARGYQAIFVPSTALASPGYDGQPVVYLYIAALEVNALN